MPKRKTKFTKTNIDWLEEVRVNTENKIKAEKISFYSKVLITSAIAGFILWVMIK